MQHAPQARCGHEIFQVAGLHGQDRNDDGSCLLGMLGRTWLELGWKEWKLVGGFQTCFSFQCIGNFIIQTDCHIFQRVGLNHQSEYVELHVKYKQKWYVQRYGMLNISSMLSQMIKSMIWYVYWLCIVTTHLVAPFSRRWCWRWHTCTRVTLCLESRWLVKLDWWRLCVFCRDEYSMIRVTDYVRKFCICIYTDTHTLYIISYHMILKFRIQHDIISHYIILYIYTMFHYSSFYVICYTFYIIWAQHNEYLMSWFVLCPNSKHNCWCLR